MSIKATIEERGNGFPDVGDYVSDSDGNLYEIIYTDNNISTNPPHGNSISALLERADWSDLDEDEEPHESLAILGE